MLTLVLIPTMLALPYNIASSASTTGRGMVWLFNLPANTIGGFIAREKARRAAAAKRQAEAQRQAELAAEQAPQEKLPDAEVVNLSEKRSKVAEPPVDRLPEAAE